MFAFPLKLAFLLGRSSPHTEAFNFALSNLSPEYSSVRMSLEIEHNKDSEVRKYREGFQHLFSVEVI